MVDSACGKGAMPAERCVSTERGKRTSYATLHQTAGSTEYGVPADTRKAPFQLCYNGKPSRPRNDWRNIPFTSRKNESLFDWSYLLPLRVRRVQKCPAHSEYQRRQPPYLLPSVPSYSYPKHGCKPPSICHGIFQADTRGRKGRPGYMGLQVDGTLV